MVFQSYALFPHMSVRENMAFGLKMARTAKDEINRRISEAARILQLEPLLDRRPRQLSGGQRQRVAIGRAIVREPKLFLFDEPLSNLDAELRTQMRVEIARLHSTLSTTMVYVTHDQVEAMTLADRIVVLRGGRVEQIGPPTEIYEKPANIFVAGFIGSPKMNFLAATVAAVETSSVLLNHEAFRGSVRLPVRSPPTVRPGDALTVGLRPEHLVLGASGQNRLDLTGDFAENLGATSQFYAQSGRGETIVIQVPGRHTLRRGESLTVSFDPAQARLFDVEGRAI